MRQLLAFGKLAFDKQLKKKQEAGMFGVSRLSDTKRRKRGDQMTSYGGKELASAFRTVRKNTIQVAEDIPEPKYGFVAAPEVRAVGRMLTHVAIAPRIWEELH